MTLRSRSFGAGVRSGLLEASVLALLLSGPVAVRVAPAHAAQPEEKVYGFVLSSLFTAINDTKYMDECPDGLTPSNDEIWLKSLKIEERQRVIEATGGQTNRSLVNRRLAASLRGPNGEDVCWNPESVIDPPMRTVPGSPVSYGLNLDGTTDGHATTKTCAHEKFVGFDRTTAVDNQLFRLMGCARGWRKDGGIETRAESERVQVSQGIFLVEVSDVSDLRNDNDVRVSFYRPVDELIKDGAAKILPYASYQIDTTRYGASAHGKIVDGVLTTEPIDAHLPFYGNVIISEMYIRDMRLEIALASDGSSAKGILAGYADREVWWDYLRKIGMAWIGRHSCPAVYAASRRLADGYPDPVTGECTAISAAYKVEFTPAFVVHPKVKTAQTR